MLESLLHEYECMNLCHMHTKFNCIILGVHVDQIEYKFEQPFSLLFCRDFMHIVLVHYLETKVTLIWCTHFLCA
jgi:hypothetical protein